MDETRNSSGLPRQTANGDLMTDAEPPRLSVVIPTYCEGKRLPWTLQEILPWLRQHVRSFEVLVVDDDSPDHTGEIVREFARHWPQVSMLVQPGRLGKGAALRRGCLAARGRHVMFMDADHATPISSLEEFLRVMEETECDVVAGVRTYQEDESRGRRIIGILGQLLAHMIVFRKAVVDSQCGFKLFTRAAAQQLFSRTRVKGGMIDVELFFLMHKLGLTCRFLPVLWANKPDSRVNVWVCIVRDPFDLLRIRLRDLLGVYQRPAVCDARTWSPGVFATGRSRGEAIPPALIGSHPPWPS